MGLHSETQVLVLEDDDCSRDTARNILRASGFKVVCARDFNEAIDLVEHGTKIDIALIDVRMPAGTPHGICFARMAQLRHPAMKIIFMSASADPNDFTLIDEDEIILHKPFAPQHLIEIVNRAAA